MARVALVGSATIDEQVGSGGGILLQAGGVGIYGGSAFRREGVAATAVCNLGDGEEGAPREILRRSGVAVAAGPAERTTRFRNRYPSPGVRVQELRAIAPPIRAEPLAPLLDAPDPVDLVHLGPLHGADLDAGLLRLLEDRAALVTLDAQGLLRTSDLGRVRERPSPLLVAALRRARIVKVDPAEFETIRRHLGTDEPALIDRFDLDELVVTRGVAGGSVFTRTGEEIPYPAVPVERTVDETGAGDCFFATYLSARIFGGRTIEESCRRAAERAARQVAGEALRREDLRLPLSPSG
ncbi:MAG: hypothetical protein GF346_06735 [Candidatus Eisenbacteria bacterium]|nr:hypothetical protein [Candidatus Latescibacterota bacterium]MBD3302124.1 hypothetical protein [Candidatus Eisenbacteria bacterium]